MAETGERSEGARGSTPPARPSELHGLIESGDAEACSELLHDQSADDAVRLLSQIDDRDRCELLSMLDPADATEVVEYLPEPQAVAALADLEPTAAARILEELPSSERVDIVAQLPRADAEEIICRLGDDTQAGTRKLLEYEPDSAGGLMDTEYLQYDRATTVAAVIEDLGANAERYARYDVQYLYVTEAGRLVGVLPMRDLVLAPRETVIGDRMRSDPLRVSDQDRLDLLAAVFEEHRFFGMPVVDADGHMVGVLHREAVEEALLEAADDVYRRSQGIVGGEELRSMPLHVRARRRLSWLSVNICLNIGAASIIAMNQGTLEAVIALAVFLPIISDMSGCSGNQAVAVSMRELTLGVARPQDLMRVILQELKVGIVNGIALGLLLGLAAFAWKGNMWFGLVVGGALSLNTMVSVMIGGGVPLALKKFGLDPALAAGPILTTVTDMLGFLLVLTFASMALPHLTGL